jgi:hypothetical protein
MGRQHGGFAAAAFYYLNNEKKRRLRDYRWINRAGRLRRMEMPRIG